VSILVADEVPSGLGFLVALQGLEIAARNGLVQNSDQFLILVNDGNTIFVRILVAFIANDTTDNGGSTHVN